MHQAAVQRDTGGGLGSRGGSSGSGREGIVLGQDFEVCRENDVVAIHFVNDVGIESRDRAELELALLDELCQLRREHPTVRHLPIGK